MYPYTVFMKNYKLNYNQDIMYKLSRLHKEDGTKAKITSSSTSIKRSY